MRSCKRPALNRLSMMNLQHDIIRGVVKDAGERGGLSGSFSVLNQFLFMLAITGPVPLFHLFIR